MSEKRVQFNNIVQNQLPAYVRDDFPLISEFLKQYYIAQEYQGAPIDLIQNIDQYVKLDKTTNLTDSVVLGSAIGFNDTTITVDATKSPTGTKGFPDSYGLLQIDDEVITYKGKTDFSFTGCIRGFSGITSYKSENNPEQLVFKETESNSHTSGSDIKNLSTLFLKEFLLKTKNQLIPGLEDRTLADGLNQNLFIKQAKDFYLSKGTDRGFEILFKALYNEDVRIIKPSDFLSTPSNAQYRVTNNIVVEPIFGNPTNLVNTTLYQNPYGKNINKAYAPITNIEEIRVGAGRTYYKIRLDSGYNRDVRVKGAVYGDFFVQPKTQVIGAVSSGSTSITVDSTVGFETPGELYVTYSDNSVGVVSYTSKSLNQFFDCTNVSKTIEDKTVVGINTFAYANYNGETIEVRINSVLNSISYPDNTYYYGAGDTARIKTLGISDNTFKTNNWFYNISPIYNVDNILLVDSSDGTYRVNLKVNHFFRLGDSASIIGNDGIVKATTVVDIPSEKSVVIRGQGSLSLTGTYTFKKNILKVSSSSFPQASFYTTNVQNVYKDKDADKYLVASPSIPYYASQPIETTDRSIKFSGTFSGDEFQITSVTDHGFYTGDAIYYTPQKTTTKVINDSGEIQNIDSIKSSLFDEGLYFVKRISSTTVKFAKSRTNIYNSKFVTLSNSTTVTDNVIKPYSFRFKTLSTQKLLREISTPQGDGSISPTTPGFTGILVNGVEILNYKSNDSVKYGKVEKVNVVSPGFNYDVINPPTVNISDSVGTGATGFVAISGSLKEIRLLDPGFDYEGTPTVSITGGNGEGARASVTMNLISHSALFNSQSQVGLGSTVSTIGFSTYHKFRNAEQITYVTSGQASVGGITTDASYFVSVQDSFTVKLHKTQADAVAGINTVSLTSYGVGNQYLRSVNKKSVVESINIVSPGSNYENKKRTTAPSGIATSSNIINIVDHGYRSGEIVKYTADGTAIGGLTSGSQYYLTKVDDNSFKLSNVNVGVGTTNKDFFYRTNQYTNLTSVGVGTHNFNYPDISVTLVGKVGISSIGSETFNARIQPVFRGEVTSLHLSNNGVGYGSSEVINFERPPLITLNSGINAQVQPVVNNGQIVEVIVLNSGRNYNSPPDLTIIGTGVGAILTPVVQNGSLTSVTIIAGGTNYTQETTVNVSSPGQGVEFQPRLQSWTINLFEKNFAKFKGDDGFITNGLNENFGLQYSHLYAPRKLRESIFSVDQDGNILYGSRDLKKINSIENPSTDHSPIIGWAYDGHPIYGPYGYATKSGGIVSQMKSGYVLDLKANRPSVSIYPEGFFVEDYTHNEVSDENVLDKNNGRFCVTPEFPKGTYAYFATVSIISADSSGPFEKYKRPVFPYLIGENYKNIPNSFNFQEESNQDSIDLSETNWCRNTLPYNLIEGTLNYEYVYIPNKLSQTIDIKAVSPGSINSIGISSSGDLYQVGDSVVFDNTNTSGDGASAKVSRIKGKTVNNISVASSSISGVEIYPSETKNEYIIFADNPHNFKNLDIINILGLSTTSSKIEGSYSAGISSNRLSVVGVGSTSSGIGTVGVTGIVTYFNVSGDLSFPSIRENDILSIESERVKVLNVDRRLSRIRVLRAVDGTTGSAHTVTTNIIENSRKLKIDAGFKADYDYRVNKQVYFDSSESVGLGTLSGVGIGTTISFSNPGTGLTQIFIPTKSIYIRQHNLKTGDLLTYSPGDGDGIVYNEENAIGVAKTLSNGQQLFVAKINDDLIGIATIRVGLDTTGTFVGIASTYRNSRTLYFTGVGTGVYHSFATNYDVITGEVTRNIVTVSTAQTHGLNNEHNVFVDVNPSISTTFTVKYNDYNRRLVLNPKSFSAVGVNTVNNTISITNHGYTTGDKVIHTSTSPSGGLENDKIYYIVRVDNNNFKLSNTDYDAKKLTPSVVGITSASIGTINPVNPPLDVYENSTVIFDLSDSSLSYVNLSTRYPAFDLNFYVDENYTKSWEKSINESTFNIQKTGTIGVSTDAKVTLRVNSNIPRTLYYKLNPVFESDIPAVKEESIVDTEVISGSQIRAKKSIYNGKHQISVASTTSFTYTLSEIPEKVSYASTTSKLSYETDCTHAYGPIARVEIKNSGKNYYSLPGITSVTSTYGSKAILEAVGTNIGKIKKTVINDIGYDFPSDNTLKPSVNLPQVIKITPFASIESIGISSVGRGYISSPDLLVFDGETNELVSDLDLKYSLGDSQVSILKNTYGINNVTPVILPVHNSNGVGISTISYNTSTKDVTVTLSVGFSTGESFPFSVNDKVLIENVSVGVGSTGRGYNSEAYNYKLFTLTAVDSNIGGIGTVTYNLSDYFTTSSITPGNFDSINSAGRIIPEKYFPSFNIKLTTNDYLPEETVTSDSASGIVENWDTKTGILRISSSEDFSVGEVIIGSSSKTQGVASSIRSYNAYLNLDASSTVVEGWKVNSGFLSDNLQRIQDSDYYQKFSYSLRSRVVYDTWNDAVSALNHTVGFKKFSDYQLETTADNRSSMVVGLSTDLTSFETVNDLVGFVNLNCVYDFDLVKENSLDVNSNSVSTEIIFANRVLTDYLESVGNRVLSIDDISGEFNSNPRPTAFSIVNTFDINAKRALKYITYVKDRRFTQQRQLLIVDLVHDGSFGYMNQYGRVETTYDQGSFDFAISGTQGQLQFYPTKFTVNDYDVTSISYNLDDNLLSAGSTVIGRSLIKTDSVAIASGITTTIVGIASTYASAKVLVQITPDSYGGNEFEFSELNVLHNGTDVEMLEYGPLITSSGPYYTSGFGTYFAYLDGSSLKVDFTPNAGVGVGTTGVINTITVGLANSTFSGIGTINMKHARLESRTTSISASGSPTENVIAEYESEGTYDVGYFMIQVCDSTNNQYQFSEFIVVDDYQDGVATYQTYDTEYGTIETLSGLGTIGSRVIKDPVGSAVTTQVLFTPNAGIDVNVNVFMNALRHEDETRDEIDFNNGTIETGFGIYQGTERDIKRAFNLTHKNDPIFEREFLGNSSSIVDLTENTISLPNHFFVSGEAIEYYHAGAGSTQAIGIASTSFVGVGTTDKLPRNIFAVKVNEDKIRIASSAQNALKSVPEVVDLTSVGIGTSHRFVSTNQNAKVIVSLDNVIQSPIVSTALTTTLADSVVTTDDLIKFTGITSFFGGDLIKIGNEIMVIEGVGIGSTNSIRVRRSWLGTALAGYSTGNLVTKVIGNYNIVDNTLNFVEAPYGNTPLGTSTNPPDERDWVGISTGSSFNGRTFMRSGITNTSNETYYKNYVFNDVSQDFNTLNNEFTLKSNGSNVSGIADENAIILVNDIFQGPGLTNDYVLSESVGVTTITFTGIAQTVTTDVGISSFPRGGIIISVGSTEGFAYQPLISAGGTATVSGLGTISTISIGNSGSGYRSGIQTVVNVGVGTSSTGIPNIEFIGTAAISGGHIVSVAITNPGSGYTSTNPPYVFFDSPLSYTNIPLSYSSDSPSVGIGTQATIDIVVGQGSSVIDFEIKNTGYGYKVGEILTLPVGGAIGIPTTSASFEEFQITIDKTFTDEFTGWSVGTLQVLDDIEQYIDGDRKSFPLTLAGNVVSIVASKGSKIDVQDVLLVFVNDILQVPGIGYVFNGGSILTFTESLKVEDSVKIIFYKGSGDTDVISREILETVKVGDDLTIGYDASIGQNSYLQEDPRTVTSVNSTDLVNTNPYFGPGNTQDENLLRPVVWCRQTEDRIINEKEVGKDREIYEPVINPIAYVIKSVGIGSTEIYVDRIRPLFDGKNENDTSLIFQNSVTFLTQGVKIAAAATAIVSTSGTISSVAISTGGVGYTTAPLVSIAGTAGVGIGATTTALAVATIGAAGTVTGIAITSAGLGYTTSNPPLVLISPPPTSSETNSVISYTGDSGIIVGFGTTSVGIGTTQMIFDLHIPTDSPLRDTGLVGTAITLSSLSTNDYFVVKNSIVGIATTTIKSFDGGGNVIAIGTAFVDNVYVVNRAELVTRTTGINSNGVGIGTSICKRVFVNIDQFDYSYSGITSSNSFGEFSWGKVTLDGRTTVTSYPARTLSGIGTNEFTGISSSTILQRTKNLKYKNYII